MNAQQFEFVTGTLGTIAAVIGAVLVVLWLCLPFAVFGLKDLVRQLIAIDRAILDELRRPPADEITVSDLPRTLADPPRRRPEID